MSDRAPKCLHCNKSTWNPQQLCPHHINMRTHPSSGAPSFSRSSIPDPSDPSHGYQEQTIGKEITLSFPEIESVTSVAVRTQAIQNLRDSVSIEVHRLFPLTDVADREERIARCEHYRKELIGRSKLQPVYMTPNDVSGLRDSSIDEFGMGHEEGVSLASYALVSEWKLARATGKSVDERGVSYKLDLDKYIESQQPFFDQAVDDEYRRQLAYYPDIIASVSGRDPINSQPVVRPWDNSMEVQAPSVMTSEELARQERIERNIELAKTAGSIALKAGKGIFGVGKWFGQTVANDVSYRMNTSKSFIDHLEDDREARLAKKDLRDQREINKMMLNNLHKRK